MYHDPDESTGNGVIDALPKIEHYRWERPTPTSQLPEAEQYAAILFKGGPEDTPRELEEECDFWAFSSDPSVILRADDDRLLMGENLEDLQRKLNERYPAPPACSFLKEGIHDISMAWKKEKEGWHRRSKYRHKDMRGWVVLKCPLVTDYRDLDQVRQLSLEHGPILLDKENVNHEKYMEAGFSPVGGGHDLIKVRWNPKAVAMRDWRKQVKAVEAMHVKAFDESLNRQVRGLGVVVKVHGGIVDDGQAVKNRYRGRTRGRQKHRF